MKAKKHKRRKTIPPFTLPNYPTAERILHGGIIIRNNIALTQDPLRIDKLLKNGIIDEMQHLYGMQIITLWTIASRPFLKAMQYAPRTGGGLSPNFEYINLGRMSAQDQFYKTMGLLTKRDHGLICNICFEEMAAIDAGRKLGLPVNSITVYVRAAFDALGNSLARMRQLKKDMEKSSENKEEDRMPNRVDA